MTNRATANGIHGSVKMAFQRFSQISHGSTAMTGRANARNPFTMKAQPAAAPVAASQERHFTRFFSRYPSTAQ